MRLYNFLAITLSSLAFGLHLEAQAQSSLPTPRSLAPPKSFCPIINSVALANALPVDFFMRVIWQESRFRPDAVGPLTHTGEQALGIAQFMPGTAAERGLFEPFNPVVALPKSAEFLAGLRREFGNLGLAAAAYNAGPERVHAFVAGARDLPLETRNYVLAITGHSVDEWTKYTNDNSGPAITKHTRLNPDVNHCSDILAILQQAAGPSMAKTEARNVPSWCRHLHHPNTSACGSVHEWPTIEALDMVKLKGHMAVLKSSPAK